MGKALGTVMLYVSFPGTREVRIPVDPTTVPVMGVPFYVGKVGVGITLATPE